MELRIFGDAEVIEAIHSAAPQTVVAAVPDDDALALGLQPSIAIAFEYLIKTSKTIYTKLLPLINARPEMEIEVEGPGGKIKLKLKNVTERTIAEAATEVMSRATRSKKKH